MYSLPSTSQTRDPLALLTKKGWPPTARNARTGEFTPPGMYFNASANNCSDLACVIASKLVKNRLNPRALLTETQRGIGFLSGCPRLSNRIQTPESTSAGRIHLKDWDRGRATGPFWRATRLPAAGLLRHIMPLGDPEARI